MTIEDIRALVAADESFPHNLNVAEVLFRMTYLENWGTGAKRIIEACREQGVEEPTWRRDGGFIYVTFKRPTKNRQSTDQVPTKQEDRPLNHRSSIGQELYRHESSAELRGRFRPKYPPSTP